MQLLRRRTTQAARVSPVSRLSELQIACRCDLTNCRVRCPQQTAITTTRCLVEVTRCALLGPCVQTSPSGRRYLMLTVKISDVELAQGNLRMPMLPFVARRWGIVSDLQFCHSYAPVLVKMHFREGDSRDEKACCARKLRYTLDEFGCIKSRRIADKHGSLLIGNLDDYFLTNSADLTLCPRDYSGSAPSGAEHLCKRPFLPE